MWAPHWPRADWHWPVDPQERPGIRCEAPDVSWLQVPSSCSSSPASITHHNVTNHSLSRPWRLLIGPWSHSLSSYWWINDIAGLPCAELLHRWSMRAHEKISHHLQSSSHTHAPHLLYEVLERIPLQHSTFLIPMLIEIGSKYSIFRILKRFSVVIDIYCTHVLTMSSPLPTFN